ncbi:hypothetical protein GCG54_00014714 [Colletotrichum gloeosporioides]|uniref:histone acetyltransferase n=1 Tax=Colletotrichum gloeosporioides TaxID=474922 RepID=A0A8H4FGT4_COLGL|nr:uncharacterized protein GCG54_00014714 [Colletotrichum gloeosporioides]KAF3801500.1 hypothetical protein GCG54_00014714 [Colletotrichum gloeosporioides]
MATYTSVRRSSTSSAGSDTAAAGSGVAAASRDDTNTKETTGASSFAAMSVSASSSSRPSISPVTATPSPLNFLSLAETSFTPLSMDSDLFPDRDFSGSIDNTTNWKSDSPSPDKQHRSTTLQPTSGKGAPSNATTTDSGMSLSDDGAESTMRAPHAPASASSAADAVAALAMSPEKEEHVSGARELDVTMQSPRQPGQGQRQEQEQEIARNAEGEGEKQGEGAELDQETISRMNPRQRYAGSTPLSLDPLQVARGSSAATDTSTAATTNTNSSSSSPSAAVSPKSQSQQAQPQSPPRSLRQSNSSVSSPPIQHIAPLALRTKNIGDNNNININTTAPNTSSITSPLSAASAASALSAPAAFTRHISTSSLRSNSSLISQIQDSLQQQQQQQQQQQHQSPSRYRHHHSSSSGSNIVQPVPKPIVRTTSDSNTFILKHPVPDLNCRSGAYVGNVAALEKTAERLSMTSSIEDAIRDLHGELKRSDSRRSSILAASVAASQSPIDDAAAQPGPLRVIPPVASIVELNNAARHGGYSPSGYVMSPNHSLTGRLRSGSKNSASGRPEIDVDAVMSRHGPGKGSTRSARSGMSGKPSLAEIAESEPVALTQRVLDDADRAPLADDDATIRRPNTHYEENGDSTSCNVGGHLDQEQSGLGLDFGGDNGRHSEDRPATPRSTATFDHKNAFDDFDGVHCQPDQYSERGGWDSREQSDGEYSDMPPPQPKTMPMPDITEPPFEPQPRPMPRPPKATQVRPQSYFDELTGQEMLYYPARVPAMLNLPPKLSRKPKTNVRNARHSKVLQAMGHPGFGKAEYLPQDPEAPAVRESKMWLPDPLAGHGATTLGEDIDGQRSGGTSIKESTAGVDSHVPAEQRDGLLDGEPEEMPMAPPPTQRRKSKMPRAADLPPQLRASAFFDLPSTTPQIEMKDGSAMATLDSILDASANAPVSAFTDHAFAGKLGSEVYGPDGKKNRRKSAAPAALLPEEHIAAAQKKKGLLPFGKKSADTSRANSMAQNDEGKALSENVDAESKKSGEESEEEEEDEFAHVLDGPPTTLLAELQLRKYNQKLRTQMPNSALVGGMHSTLLELDAVAEAQKRHREKKKIALAWEDGANDEKEDSDDDEVPLGVLYANQGVVVDVNRPIGLMEQREREENEPLSSRRARLTGQPEPPRTLRPQRSAMTLNAGLSQLRLNHMPSSERVRPQEESEDDEPGETLGERLRRLRAKDEADHNNLPKARPVSRAFSAEILTQFGEPEEKTNEDKGKEKEVPPEEETLGQRRKRLQAEREAREREMTLSGGLGGGLGINQPEAPPLRKQHSLADVLGSHPGIHHENPALKEQARLQEEQRKVRAAEAKMAAVRAQMPTSLDKPKGLAPTGGYLNGRFNDGNGGTAGSRRVSGLIDNVQSSNAGAGVNMAPGWNRSSMAFSSYGAPLQMPQQQQQQPAYGGLIGQAGMTQMANKPAIASGYGSYTAGGMGGAGAMGGMNNMNGMGMNMNNIQMNPYGGGMGMPMQTQPMAMNMGMQQQQMMPMQMQQMQMQMQPGQPQSIERWRQSIMY